MADPVFTYTPGSGQPKDRMRLMIPDRLRAGKKPPAMFDDQELADYYAEFGDLRLAVAAACETVAMDEARRQLSVSVSSGMSVSRSGATLWLQRAKQLREDYKEAKKSSWEFIDSVSDEISLFGEDNSKYVGDVDNE